MTPLFDDGEIQFDIYAKTNAKKELNIQIYNNDTLIVEEKTWFEHFMSKKIKIWNIKIFETNLHHYGKSWTPESPFLYDVVFEELVDGVVVDRVKSYFGMRKIHSENGMTYLNNRPYYFKLVLDQGYFPKSLMTAPSDEDLLKDITLAKEMGFNGCRKHQKVEEARFMYHADRLGYLIWTELPSTAIYDTKYIPQIVNEWMRIIQRDYNSPSVVSWVPLNESWGVANINQDVLQQNYSLALYHLAKSMDSTRFVISNDGWEQTTTDLCAIHNYAHGSKDELKKQQQFEESLKTKEAILNYYPAHRNIYAQGFKHQGEPILLTEFGGISFNGSDKNGWGYTSVLKEQDFLNEYKRLITNIADSEIIAGYCYTQLTDVMQEVNGLLKYNREPKTDLTKIKEINDLAGFKLTKRLD